MVDFFSNDNKGSDVDDDDERIVFIKTPLENIHIKTAEAIYLNGGKTTFGAKARQSRFYNL